MPQPDFTAAVESRAVEFRAAFDAIKPEHPLLPSFPTGWCTMASMLLGEYLRNAGLGDFQSRSGIKQVADFSTSHAWLERNGLLVDITADQYADVDKPVIVTSESRWHQEWSGHMGVRVASLAYYDHDDYRDLLRGIYDQLSSAAEGFVAPPDSGNPGPTT